jgi:hypothetical protein
VDRGERAGMDRRRFLQAALGAGAAAGMAAGGLDGLADLLGAGPTGVGPFGAAAFADDAPAGGPGIQARWVIDENARPGTSSWYGIDVGKPEDAECYCDSVSAVRGDRVRMFVSTTASSFHVIAYRMGWYQGIGARAVWRSVELPGVRQATPYLDPATNMIEARWDPSLELAIDEGWPPGAYLLTVFGSNGKARRVPLIVRDDSSTAAFAVMHAVTTWQAYNLWGGYSLYFGRSGSGQSFDRRSRVVSFDRPYDDHGAGQFVGTELPVVMVMERAGLDVTYTTNVDVHQHADLLTGHRALLSLGHDEYWSKAMRDGAEAARDAGVNLAFFGANAAYRQIRFDSSPLGPNRHVVCYKSAAEDPMARTNPSLTTVNWRDAPVSRPEASLIGQQYESNPVDSRMIVADPNAWVYDGLNLRAGQQLDVVVGPEYDHYVVGPTVPTNVQILAHSPVNARGRSSFADMTYYTAASGAGVFDTGTQVWTTQLVPPPHGSTFSQAALTITNNVLAVFGAGPAGQTHPSVRRSL